MVRHQPVHERYRIYPEKSETLKDTSTTRTVLHIEPDVAVANLMTRELQLHGFKVTRVDNSNEALKVIENLRPHMILSEVVFPAGQMGGFELLRKVREHRITPFIFLTTQGDLKDIVRGLTDGADDYVVKPANPLEVRARIQVVLSRTAYNPEPERIVLARGNVTIDLERRVVRKNGEVVDLSRSEWMLIQFLASNTDKALLFSTILSRVWGAEYVDQHQYLRVWVSRLRTKLESNPNKPVIITTLTGIGYLFNTEQSTDPVAGELVGALTS